MKLAALAATLLGATILVLFALASPVHITLDRYAAFAPADIRVRLLVEPHDANRSLCIYVAGPLREDESCFPHTKADLSQRTVLFTRLPAGDYEFWAVLVRSDRSTHTSIHATARILGPGND